MKILRSLSIILLLAASTITYAQLNILRETERKEVINQLIYSFSFGNARLMYNGTYYQILAASNYRYFKAYHYIVLGTTKESAILSLRELEQMRAKKNAEWLIANPDGRKVHLFHEDGLFVFATDSMPGYSASLSDLKFPKAIEAINHYTPSF